MKLKSLLVLVVALACAVSVRAGTHTWSGAQDGYWSNPSNWSSGGAPSAFESAPIIIQFPSSQSARRVCTNDIPDLWVDVLTIFGSDYVLSGESMTMKGTTPPFPYAYNLNCGGTNVEVDADLTLWNNVTIGVGAAGGLSLAGGLHGSGGFTKYNSGILRLNGDRFIDQNDYSGVTTVLDGTLELDTHYYGAFSVGPSISVPGPLVIGDTDMQNSAVVTALDDDQFAGATLTINPNGTLNLLGVADTGDLVMTGGTIQFGEHYYCDWGGCGMAYGLLMIHSNLVSYPTALGLATLVNTAGAGGIGFYPNGAPSPVMDVEGNLVIGANIVAAPSLTKTGPGELFLSGTNSYPGDTLISAGRVVAGGDYPFGPNSSANVTVSDGTQLLVTGAFTAPNVIHLNGFGPDRTASLVVEHDGATFSGQVQLDSDTAIWVSNSGDTVTADFMGGMGQLNLRGSGTLQLAGAVSNQMTGSITVESGTLALNKPAGVSAITGLLVIGTGGAAAQVKLLNHNQFTTNIPTTINASGTLNLNGFNQTAGPLTLQNGGVTTYGGALTLSADVLATNGVGSMIAGNLSLGSAKRAFHLAPGYSVNIQAAMTDGGPSVGFELDGGGTLTLSGANTFSGPVNVKAGVLYARNDLALGSTASGTTIASGARLAIDGRNLGAEPITLNGDGGDGYGAISCAKTNTCTGVVTLASEATLNVVSATDRLTFSGAVKGPKGLVKIGAGTLALAGSQANTYSGQTTVSEGVLELNKTSQVAVPGTLNVGDDVYPPGSYFVRFHSGGQVAANAHVTVHQSGVLDFINSVGGAQAFGSLSGTGTVYLSLTPLLVGGDNSDMTFGGMLTGFAASSLTKQGTGKLMLNGTSPTWSGSTIINGGTLSLNGSQPLSPITINAGGTLAGNGVGGLIVANAGSIDPGNSVGLLSSGNFNLAPPSQFQVELNGTNAGVGYDQVKVTGTVSLGNATLVAKLGFSGAVSNRFVLLANDGNDPVVGTFNGLPEGATFIIGGAQFQITYAGGDGNDVVLTELSLSTPPGMGGIQKLPNGQIQIAGSGLPGGTYTVQATDDLRNPNGWQDIDTATADGNGALQFVDSDAPNHSQRFYRFKAP